MEQAPPEGARGEVAAEAEWEEPVRARVPVDSVFVRTVEPKFLTKEVPHAPL